MRMLITFTIGHHVSEEKSGVDGGFFFTPAQVRTVIAEAMARTGADAYTLIDAEGYWQGQSEPSTRVEVVTEEPAACRAAAILIRDALRQDCVLYVETQIHYELI